MSSACPSEDEGEEEAAGAPQVMLPWRDPAPDTPASEISLGRRLVSVDMIRFTQKHVYDSFSTGRSIMELIDGLLSGGVDHSTDVPLIRVAWNDGAFWSIDNRRTFIYKHCRLGRACVEVCRWEENPEFAMKHKNGEMTRTENDGGNRVGLKQRLDIPLPRSSVMNDTYTEVQHYMTPEAQEEHDRLLDEFAIWCSRKAAFEDQLASDITVTGKYEAKQPDGSWLPATILKAYEDGSFEAQLFRGTSSFVYPKLISSKLRQRDSQEDCATEVQADLLLKPLTFVVPPGMRSAISEAWCALCGMIVGSGRHDLAAHEKAQHKPADFVCMTCGASLPTSQDLRRHSRSKAHEIHLCFQAGLDGKVRNKNLGRSNAGRHRRHRSSRRGEDQGRRQERSDGAQPHTNEQSAGMPETAVFHVPGASGDFDELFVVPKGSSARSLRCAVCAEVVNSRDELRRHEHSAHRPYEFKCYGCPGTFAASEDLRRHSRSTQHPIHCRFKLEEDLGSQSSALSQQPEMRSVARPQKPERQKRRDRHQVPKEHVRQPAAIPTDDVPTEQVRQPLARQQVPGDDARLLPAPELASETGWAFVDTVEDMADVAPARYRPPSRHRGYHRRS
eukprot:TRINITY_DN37070_c0_g2_i1.p1 TRINITY_DN37070_c0_g2~~TRINITY_DN37070_c0_g2_i1.p1  ORF type:complete len:615 (+),score=60.72 TRINITY_DN37070_c0_g2_i1:151-1995(+)